MAFDPVKDYANKVLDGKIIAGPSVRAACARHLRDLDTASQRKMYWDLDAARHVFGFFDECLKLRDGQFEGRPFSLEASQKFTIGSIFGWKNDDGSRRFRQVYEEIAKGAGKSPKAAGVGLYLFCADDEAAAEVYFAGPTKDQAQICFRDAVGFVERDEELSTAIRPRGENPVEELFYGETQSFLRPISADARKKSGYRPSGVVIDELHELGRNEDLIHMLRAGFKFRRNPLLFMITNSGFDRQTVCWRYHEHAIKVAAGVETDDSFFSFVCELDKGDDPLKDEKCWPKTNPLLGVTVSKHYIRNEIRQSRASGQINKCLRLNFCVWTGAESSWIAPSVWDQALYDYTPAHIEAMRGRKCIGGLDLSTKRDLTALTLLFRAPESEMIDALSWFWTPLEGIQEKSENDGVQYEYWADPHWEDQLGFETYLNATPGPEVDYSVVATKVAELNDTFDIEFIAFDPYKIEEFKKALDEINCPVKLVPHLQGASKTRQNGLWMPGSIALLESDIYSRRIRIARNPVMTSCAMSATCLPIDPQGNRIFSKRIATRRIDGAVSLAIARGALELSGKIDAAPQIRFIRRHR